MRRANPHRGEGVPGLGPLPSDDPSEVATLLARCPKARMTPLVPVPRLAAQLGIAELWLKDERPRMGLGSFKALGAAYVIARDADQGTAKGQTYIAASAGNHGLSVAVGARIFCAKAVILLAETVSESFAQRLRAEGAEVRRAGAIYEESMAAAQSLAETEGWTLLSDSSWPGYTEIPWRVMQGYTQLAAETARQMRHTPSHILLQAGVGGMAAAVAAYARRAWGDAPQIIVVEPEAAPALLRGIEAGEVVEAQGPVSSMGRLDCKEASLIALAGLARDADQFVTLTDAQAEAMVDRLSALGLPSTPSGAAGVAALTQLGLPPTARVLCILSEGA